MSDSKSRYSAASSNYIEIDVRQHEIDAQRYARSKSREQQFNDNWMKTQVDINEVVDDFTPSAEGRRDGMKYVFENDLYLIKADMPAGYLRIFDKARRIYLMPNGTPCPNIACSHFKIKKREEM